MKEPTLYACCPSYALRGPSEKAGNLAAARGLARRMGWRVVASPLLDRYPGAGAWIESGAREADIGRALRHDVVWACRGGYGAVHLTGAVLAAQPRKRPLLIGYSDATVLHTLWWTRRWGEGYYGALPADLARTRAGTSLLALLRGGALARAPCTDASVRVLRAGEAEGPCFAACVSVLAGLCGTPAQPDLAGAVLAVEDIEESPYRVDFALAQLQASGALRGVRALVGGAFPHKQPDDYQGPTVDEILAGWGERLGVPVLARLPFGHMHDGLFLPVGRAVRLRAGADGSWELAFRPRRASPGKERACAKSSG